eukprot:CAMPEP_0118997614 /NCGR_PEP_ID=MMETSP1173-20130426/62049_1 /TAXON_ID=1034831 /ORGANISM="Rhizochromulina marina cf, Strain CCMP1243" /LENGTH=474 /DNA_ID=CAMNT_0006949071 /DNA_START=81 /DNA_END=1505 /DNA_ORIENTATION=+
MGPRAGSRGGSAWLVGGGAFTVVLVVAGVLARWSPSSRWLRAVPPGAVAALASGGPPPVAQATAALDPAHAESRRLGRRALWTAGEEDWARRWIRWAASAPAARLAERGTPEAEPPVDPPALLPAVSLTAAAHAVFAPPGTPPVSPRHAQPPRPGPFWLDPTWFTPPPPPLDLTVAELKSTFSYHTYLSRKHKLLIATIPKVACTEFMRLAFRMNGDRNWRKEPHFRRDRAPLWFSKLSVSEATDILTDPTWTKAVFFRDPKRRLLSAYLDKFVQHDSYSIKVFQAPRGTRFTFEQFVKRVVVCSGTQACMVRGARQSQADGLHVRTNPHWRPQVYINGMAKYLPYFNFVGSFERLENHTRALLEGLGVWEQFGASGWGKDGSLPIFHQNTASHRTGSISLLEKYYPPDLAKQVENAYRMDYGMLHQIGLLAPASSSSRSQNPSGGGGGGGGSEPSDLPVTGLGWQGHSPEEYL